MYLVKPETSTRSTRKFKFYLVLNYKELEMIFILIKSSSGQPDPSDVLTISIFWQNSVLQPQYGSVLMTVLGVLVSGWAPVSSSILTTHDKI